MTLLDAPASSDELYDSRGEEVTLARPLFTGDVFQKFPLPGIEKLSSLATIISHPCSMRSGPQLAQYITMAAVMSRAEVVPHSAWASGYYRMMPLPDLFTQNIPFHYVDLTLLCTVRSELLDRTERVACLSEYGVQLLQQRHIYNGTRVLVDLPTIQHELAHLCLESELTEDWAIAAMRKEFSLEDSEVAKRAEKELQAFLGPGNSQIRANLKDQTKRSLAIREVRREITRRYGP